MSKLSQSCAVRDGLQQILLSSGYECDPAKIYDIMPDTESLLLVWDRELPGKKALVYSLVQNSRGSSEFKLLFQAADVNRATRDREDIVRIYLVLSGDGWSPRIKEEFLTGRVLQELRDAERVMVITYSEFLDRIRRGDLLPTQDITR